MAPDQAVRHYQEIAAEAQSGDDLRTWEELVDAYVRGEDVSGWEHPYFHDEARS